MRLTMKRIILIVSAGFKSMSLRQAVPLSIIFIAGIILSGCDATFGPIVTAAGNGSIRVVKKYFNESTQMDKANAIVLAAERGNLEIVKFLIERGVKIESKDVDGATALYGAALNGRTSVVQYLVEKGADVNAANNDGYVPLAMAAKNNHLDIVKYLIEKGASIDTAMANLAHIAVDDKVKRLLASYRVKAGTEPVKEPAQTAITKDDIERPYFEPSALLIGENDIAVIIGIEGYQGIPKSDYSYDDARLVEDYAKALGFKPRNIEMLLDERATKSAIENTIRTWLRNKAKPESRVFIYYSGHGAPEPETGDAYLVPYDGDPNYLPDTGYPLKRLYENLGRLQVSEVTVVLDAGFSGAGGRSVLAKGARPLVMMAEGVAIPENMAVFTATQGTQISTSSPEKGHGIFTYYFLKALKDGKKNILDIYEYIKPLVEDEAKQLNIQQSPNINPDAEKLKGRFGLRK